MRPYSSGSVSPLAGRLGDEVEALFAEAKQ